MLYPVKKYKLLSLVAIFFIVLAIPFTVYVSNQKQVLQQHAQTVASGFAENFAYGTPTSPQPFQSPRWIIFPSMNDGGALDAAGNQYLVDIPAGHGAHCEAPIGNADPSMNNHFIPHATEGREFSVEQMDNSVKNIDPNNMYICNNHMMTVSFGSYSQTAFADRYLMDLSGGNTVHLQFKVNPYSAGRAGWWDLYIADPNEFLLNSDSFSKNEMIIEYGGIPSVSEIINHTPVLFPSDTGGDPIHTLHWQDYCDETNDIACTDPRIRRTFQIAVSKTHYSFAIVKGDGTLYGPFEGNWPKPLPFDQALFKIAHWTYNPTKSDFFNNNKWIKGDPFSISTFHWSNFAFDGNATPWKTGYPLEKKWIDTTYLGSSSTAVAHVHITSSDLRNPSLWGLVTDGGVNGQFDAQSNPVRYDPQDTTHWIQVSVNGGAWLDAPSVREYSPDTFVDSFGNQINDASQTFRVILPAGSVHEGDNTVQFRNNQTGTSANGHPIHASGFTVDYAEIQVDPNADLPPANPGVSQPTPTTPITPNATTTPVISQSPTSAPSAIPTDTPLPTDIPTPTPTDTLNHILPISPTPIPLPT